MTVNVHLIGHKQKKTSFGVKSKDKVGTRTIPSFVSGHNVLSRTWGCCDEHKPDFADCDSQPSDIKKTKKTDSDNLNNGQYRIQ